MWWIRQKRQLDGVSRVVWEEKDARRTKHCIEVADKIPSVHSPIAENRSKIMYSLSL